MSAKFFPKQWLPSSIRRQSLKGLGRCGLACAAIAFATAGCSGNVGGNNFAAGGAGGSEPPDETSRPSACDRPRSVGAGQWRRLTSTQYINSVRELLGQTPDVSGLVADNRTGSFRTNVRPVQTEEVDAYDTMAKALAEKAVADLPKLAPCDTKTSSEDRCAADFIKNFGTRAFRRPLLPAEEKAFAEVYMVGKVESHTAGIRLVVQTALSSPSFIYLVETGTASEGGLRKLTGFEVAARLSYNLTGSSPDAELFEAAKEGALDTVQGVEEHAKKLVQSDKFVAIAQQFHLELTGVDAITKPEVSKTAYPEFDAAMRTAMLEEPRNYIDFVMTKGEGSIEEIFSGAYVFPSGPLAKVYGDLKVDGDGRAQITDGTRAGLLTLAGVQAVHPKSFSPRMAVNRGHMVRRDFLCQLVPPVTDIVDFTLPPNASELSAQDLLRRHQENDSCKGCHRLMDPIGFGFEMYDQMGKHRTEDGGGNSIITSGQIVDLESGDGVFANIGEMSEILAKSPEVRTCMSTQWMRFALAREPDENEDSCSLAAVTKSFSKRKGDIRQAVLSLVSSDAFRFIRGE